MCVFAGSGSPGPFPLLGLLVGALIGLLLLGILVLGAVRIGRCASGGEGRRGGGSAAAKAAAAAVGGQRPGNLPLKEKANLPLRPDVEDLYDMDDKNPDVIPCNKGEPGEIYTQIQLQLKKKKKQYQPPKKGTTNEDNFKVTKFNPF